MSQRRFRLTKRMRRDRFEVERHAEPRERAGAEAAGAAEPEGNVNPACIVNPISSRCCELGTSACVVRHSDPPRTSADVVTDLYALSDYCEPARTYAIVLILKLTDERDALRARVNELESELSVARAGLPRAP